jgi:hypothetical protein
LEGLYEVFYEQIKHITTMANLKLTKRQKDLVGDSVLKKIEVDRRAISMITNQKAIKDLSKEISELNEILMLLTLI